LANYSGERLIFRNGKRLNIGELPFSKQLTLGMRSDTPSVLKDALLLVSDEARERGMSFLIIEVR